nr:hypothetical protein [uncultured Albidiferax sp.]
MLSRISVGRQLGLAFGIVVVLVLVFAVTAWSRMAAMHQDFESLVDTTLPALNIPSKDREEVVQKAAVKEPDAALAR